MKYKFQNVLSSPSKLYDLSHPSIQSLFSHTKIFNILLHKLCYLFVLSYIASLHACLKTDDTISNIISEKITIILI